MFGALARRWRALSTLPDGPGRVLFFDAYPHAYGGGQRATHLIMSGLRARGWSVDLATPAGGIFPDTAAADGFTVRVVAIPDALRVYGRQTTGLRVAAAALRLPFVWLRMAGLIRGQFDVVHSADHRGHLLAGPAARLARIPSVWHIHGIDRTRLLNLAGSALADSIIVPSQAMADDMPGLRVEKVTVIPYALSEQAFNVERHPTTTPVALTVARLHPDKGLDILLDAVSTVRCSLPTLRVVIAGPSQRGFEAHERALREQRHRLELDDLVEFRGPVDRAQPLLAQATLFVLSSRERTELQPISVLEAMAAGVPVVATAVGSVPEMLGDDERGLLVAPEDPASLAQAMIDVFADPNEAQGRADAARHYVEDRRAEQLIDRIEGVYRSL